MPGPDLLGVTKPFRHPDHLQQRRRAFLQQARAIRELLGEAPLTREEGRKLLGFDT